MTELGPRPDRTRFERRRHTDRSQPEPRQTPLRVEEVGRDICRTSEKEALEQRDSTYLGANLYLLLSIISGPRELLIKTHLRNLPVRQAEQASIHAFYARKLR